MAETFHVYGQEAWHDDVQLVGTRDALMQLRRAITEALTTGTGSARFVANDGEGYTLYLRCQTQTELAAFALPYHADWVRPSPAPSKGSVWTRSCRACGSGTSWTLKR